MPRRIADKNFVVYDRDLVFSVVLLYSQTIT